MVHRCLFFDLDGTLVDSLPDLAAAVNRLRREQGLATLELNRVRSYVGDGATMLVQRALPEGRFSQQLLDQFLADYERNLCTVTRPYPGIVELLNQLCGRELAVITNKPERMARELLSALGLAAHFRLILGGDSCAGKKPAPDQILDAMCQLEVDPAACLMIGDHHTDLRAAQAAGIASCFCAWGYGHDGGETPDLSASSVAELSALLHSK